MKKIFTAIAIVLFTISVGAQEKPATKTESCTAKHDSHTKMTPEEIAKCKAKCDAEGKKCTAEEMTKCKTVAKSCCAKK